MQITTGVPAVLIGIVGVLACREPRAATPEGLPAGAPEGSLARYGLTGEPDWRVTLPSSLREISGLAVTEDGRVFAHGDEEATVHQIDPRTGRVLKRFALAPTGNEPDLGKKRSDDRVAGDFEGLAIADDRFYLVASNGVLLEFAEGEDGSRVSYTAHATPLADICEVEGLAHDRRDDALLLLCKTMESKAEREQVAVFAWSRAERTLSRAPRLSVPWSALTPVTGDEAFNASALEPVPGGRSLAVVAGPQRLFAEIAGDGAVLGGGSLPRETHPQPESLAFLPDGMLLVASEGGKGEATLSGYAPP